MNVGIGPLWGLLYCVNSLSTVIFLHIHAYVLARCLHTHMNLYLACFSLLSCILQTGLLWLLFPFKVSLDVYINLLLLILRCWGWRKPFLECQVFISPHNIFMHLKHQGLPSRGKDDQRAARVFLGCFRAIILSFMGSHLPFFFSSCRHLGQRAFSLRSKVLWLVGMKYSNS